MKQNRSKKAGIGSRSIVLPAETTTEELVAESVAANFEVLPLLLGRVRVKSLFIQGARMNIEAARWRASCSKARGAS